MATSESSRHSIPARHGKWLPGLRADTPMAEAACHALAVRLDVVQHYLPRALHQSDQDPEHVHQLRVGTRRANAALRIFAECLPGKARRAARRLLRTIRRAAGAARDWDVFQQHLAGWASAQSAARRPGADWLLGYALAQRAMAQSSLIQAAGDPDFAVDRTFARTVAAVRRPKHRSQRRLLDLAGPLLAERLDAFDEAAAGDLENYSQLHQVRIAGKRLRYAMEIFAACFPRSFKVELYPQVEDMQEILGHANDSHVAEEHLLAVRESGCLMGGWKRIRPGMDAFLRHHRQQLEYHRKLFLAWWQQWCGEYRERLRELISAEAQ